MRRLMVMFDEEALKLDGVTEETLDNFKDNKGDEENES